MTILDIWLNVPNILCKTFFFHLNLKQIFQTIICKIQQRAIHTGLLGICKFCIVEQQQIFLHEVVFLLRTFPLWRDIRFVIFWKHRRLRRARRHHRARFRLRQMRPNRRIRCRRWSGVDYWWREVVRHVGNSFCCRFISCGLDWEQKQNYNRHNEMKAFFYYLCLSFLLTRLHIMGKWG